MRHLPSRLDRLFTLCLMLAGAGCGSLASEPRIISTVPVPTITPTIPPDVGKPVAPINIARGAELFQGPQGCALCHGSAGHGDGPVAPDLSCPLPDLANLSDSRTKTILAWFQTVTDGNNAGANCLMPPWKGLYDEADRWAVTNYVYALHYTSDMLSQGKGIWDQQCVSCHGATGADDGPQAKSLPNPHANYTDPAALIGHSDSDLWERITTGFQDGTHSFKNTLSDDQRWAVIAYMRSLSWETGAPGPASTDEATTQPPTFTAEAATQAPVITLTPPLLTAVAANANFKVNGKISNGTLNGKIPANLPLTLHVIQDSNNTFQVVQTLQTTTSADGSFTFNDVQRQTGMVYTVTTQYAGVPQTSQLMQATASDTNLDLSFKVYEVANDPSLVHISLEEVFVDFTGPTTAQIQEIVHLTNIGDHVSVSSSKLVNGAPLALAVALPLSAENVTLSNASTSKFSLSADGQIQSVLPPMPGETTTVQVSYTLAFSNTLDIDEPTLYQIDAMNVYVSQQSGSTLEGNDFGPGQPVQVQTTTYDGYTLQHAIKAGSTTSLTFQVAEQAQEVQRNTLAFVLIAAMLIFGATLGAIWWLNRRSDPVPPTSQPVKASDQLVKRIAELDDRFAAGKIEHNEYKLERDRLKTELVELLRQVFEIPS